VNVCPSTCTGCQGRTAWKFERDDERGRRIRKLTRLVVVLAILHIGFGAVHLHTAYKLGRAKAQAAQCVEAANGD
jgi:hypothetical protein